LLVTILQRPDAMMEPVQCPAVRIRLPAITILPVAVITAHAFFPDALMLEPAIMLHRLGVMMAHATIHALPLVWVTLMEME